MCRYYSERNNLTSDMGDHFQSIPGSMFPTLLMLTGEVRAHAVAVTCQRAIERSGLASCWLRNGLTTFDQSVAPCAVPAGQFHAHRPSHCWICGNCCSCNLRSAHLCAGLRLYAGRAAVPEQAMDHRRGLNSQSFQSSRKHCPQRPSPAGIQPNRPKSQLR